jgi:hypothetical protein
MKYAVVTCIQTFRTQYCVELGEEHPLEYALDVVTCEEAHEMEQKFLTETIVNEKLYDTEEEIVELFTEECVSEEQIKESITRVKEWESE